MSLTTGLTSPWWNTYSLTTYSQWHGWTNNPMQMSSSTVENENFLEDLENRKSREKSLFKRYPLVSGVNFVKVKRFNCCKFLYRNILVDHSKNFLHCWSSDLQAQGNDTSQDRMTGKRLLQKIDTVCFCSCRQTLSCTKNCKKQKE